MKRAKSYVEAPRIDLYPSFPQCPLCGAELEEAYRRERAIQKLSGAVRARVHVMHCSNASCALRTADYRPEAEDVLALPGMTFGLEVVVWVGQQRYEQHRTRREMHRELVKRGVRISEREVDYLGEAFLALATTSIRKDTQAQEELRQQGGIVLSIDGVQPEKGNETLYLVRDVLSGRVLEGENLLSSAASEIGRLLARVKELGIPVVGVVSDKQESILRAIQQEFPGVPHQVCQLHYLRDLSLPWVEEDRPLKTQLKKEIRGIRDVERRAEKLEAIPEAQIEAKVAKDYCLALRTVMNDDGKYPLEPPGIQLYERLEKIEKSLSACQRARPSKLLGRLITLLAVVDRWRTTYERVQQVYGWIRGVAHLLNQIDREPASQEAGAQERLREQVSQIQAQAPADLQLMAAHVVKLTTAFVPRLFAYLRDRRIPRTDNDLEMFIGAIKKSGRRRRGKKNLQQYILREGAAVAFLLGAGESIDWMASLPKVPYEDFRAARARLRRKDERSKEWRIRRDLPAFLSAQEGVWGTSSGTR